MQLRLIAVGKLRESYLVDAAADFRRRLRPYHRLEEIEVRAADGVDPARAMASEGEAIAKLLAPHDHVWLLERDGEQLASEELAARIGAAPHAGIERITIVVGGAHGVSAALLRRANLRWSLSRLTFLHEWARVIVLEQLYRAAKISTNEPYHK